jgi:hypothetical protein
MSASDHGSSSRTSPQLNVTLHAADGGVDQLDPSSCAINPNTVVAGQKSHTLPDTVIHREPQTSPTLFTMDDLSLLHHWTLSTSLSISESDTFDTYWQSMFPQMALDYPHMMHGILSVAALHLAHQHPESAEEYLVTAAQHHNIALRGFHDTVGRLDDQNSDALFACSNLNVLYVLRNSVERYNVGSPTRNSSDRISQALGAEWIPMIRGVEAVLASVYERVLQGPLKAMLYVGNWDDIDPGTSSSPEETHLRKVSEIWSGGNGDAVYDGALYFLRKCNAYVRQFSVPPACEREGREENRRVWSGLLFWFHYAPDEYFLRLQQRQPVALVLFAHFGAIFYGARGFWFVGDCGRNIVKVVDELLGDYWNSALEWPKETVGLD